MSKKQQESSSSSEEESSSENSNEETSSSEDSSSGEGSSSEEIIEQTKKKKKTKKTPQEILLTQLQLKEEYRKLLNYSTQNLDLLKTPNDSHTIEILKRATDLFKTVQDISVNSVASLDSELLHKIAQIQFEKVVSIPTTLSERSPDEFITQLVDLYYPDPESYTNRFGGKSKNRKRKQPLRNSDLEENENNFGVVEGLNIKEISKSFKWSDIGKTALQYINITPTIPNFFSTIFIPNAELSHNAQKRRQAPRYQVAKTKKPKNVKKDKETETSTTSERSIQLLHKIKQTNSEGLEMVNLLKETPSFTDAVESIFELSFLVRAGFVKIKARGNKPPVIVVRKDVNKGQSEKKNQSVFTLTMENLKEISNL
ncbi:non-structural maintenance of chromosomes element 4 [Anaeramoeba flamelloides]|uniref:Non-structural maintenance of chromosomes element 4 n=1 Tax=Anaeramoeba flamelloides TaxID=1746091 RepID=A0ABQ8Y4X8_9EUKA|nr:non-structural maintenance of chromosomes element 4 [Anaeramoeba flamelloides]